MIVLVTVPDSVGPDLDRLRALVGSTDMRMRIVALGQLSESMEYGIRAFLAAQDRDALVEAMVAPDNFVDKDYFRAVARPMLDALLGGQDR